MTWTFKFAIISTRWQRVSNPHPKSCIQWKKNIHSREGFGEVAISFFLLIWFLTNLNFLHIFRNVFAYFLYNHKLLLMLDLSDYYFGLARYVIIVGRSFMLFMFLAFQINSIWNSFRFKEVEGGLLYDSGWSSLKMTLSINKFIIIWKLWVL